MSTSGFTKGFITAEPGRESSYYQDLANNSGVHRVVVRYSSFEEWATLDPEEFYSSAEETALWRAYYESRIAPYGNTWFNNSPEYEAWWYATGGSESVEGAEGSDTISESIEGADGSDTISESVEGADGSDTISKSEAPSITTQSYRDLQSVLMSSNSSDVIQRTEISEPLAVGRAQLFKALIGTPGSDELRGSDEGDILIGGQNKDELSGGGGPDAFLFETPGEFGKQNADVITDFDPDEGDKVLVSSAAFEGVSKVKFASVTGKKEVERMSGTNKNFIYDDKKGVIYYNANGRQNGYGPGGEFAQLIGAPDLSKTDFAIV
jgi:Ca2+-binding RTX toxin-like protein